jgi:hypothetical protein
MLRGGEEQEMTKRSRTRRAGQVGRFDFQADIHGGQYELVERIAPNTWTCKHLPPDEQTCKSIQDCPAWGEDPKAEIARRQQQAGQTFKMQFVSSAQYARYF